MDHSEGRLEQTEQKTDDQEDLKAQIRELEQDLAQTKLRMVEAKCRIQVGARCLVVVLDSRDRPGPGGSCDCRLGAGAGAREGNPGQPPPGRQEQLDQQGLHLPADLRRRSGPSRSALAGLELAHRLPLRVERQEVFMASQREPG